MDGSTLKALDSQNRTLWQIPFPNLDSATLALNEWPDFLLQDVDSDNRNEVIVNFYSRQPNSENGRLICFDDDGRLLWEFPYGKKMTVDGRYFEPFYRGVHAEWIDTPSASYILTIAYHAIWYPAQITLLDPALGTPVSEYWHPGYINNIAFFDFNHDGQTEMLIGGINNPGPGFGHAGLAVLEIPFQNSGSDGNFFGNWNQKEQAYLLFPWPDVFKARNQGAPVMEINVQEPERLLVVIGTLPNITLHYYMDESLRILDLRPSDGLVAAHNNLTNQGLLDHQFHEDELTAWKRVLRFSTAPDGNSAKVRRLLGSQ